MVGIDLGYCLDLLIVAKVFYEYSGLKIQQKILLVQYKIIQYILTTIVYSLSISVF